MHASLSSYILQTINGGSIPIRNYYYPGGNDTSKIFESHAL